MATDSARRASKRLERGTEFQLYVNLPPNVVDFTERRLLLCIDRAKDAQQRLFLVALVNDYRRGHVAVAWRRGRPVAIRVERAT